MITTPNGVKVRKSEQCFRSKHDKCKASGCECGCHEIPGKCPYCSGTVKPHHGDVVQCSSCGQLINKGELKGVRA